MEKLTPRRTALILLAAGRSSRFADGEKLLQPFRGLPLGAHALALGRGLPVAARIAVMRADMPALAVHAAGYDLVANDDSAAGMGRSIALGVAALTGRDVDACLILLADMPLVTRAHVDALFSFPDQDIVASCEDGISASVAMPPALFAAQHFAALAMLEGDRGARALLAGATVVRAPAAMLADVDTAQDLARLKP